MVIIQPFEYEKTTAFKERVQIANKVNEIINLFNELDIESKINIFNEEIEIINGKIAEIDNALVEVNDAVDTVEGYNARLTSVENESVSLDARLDNIEPIVSSDNTKIGVLENKDLENVKLSGNQTIADIKTFSSSPIIPNPPSGDTSTKAVNTNWVSQTGDSSPNNLIHRTGNESKTGIMTFLSLINGLCCTYQTESSGARPNGTYQVFIKIPKTEIVYGAVRSHIVVAIFLRGGAGGMDLLDVSFNVRNPTGINMALPRGFNYNVTYVVSHDTDYVYISRVNNGNSLDGISAEICMAWGITFNGNLSPNNLISDSERQLIDVPGTEIARVDNI